jgi:hypothetical protein
MYIVKQILLHILMDKEKKETKSKYILINLKSDKKETLIYGETVKSMNNCCRIIIHLVVFGQM